MNKYQHGASFAILFQTKDANGALANAPGVRVVFQKDTGSLSTLTFVSTPAITQLSTGSYRLEVRVGFAPILSPGHWHYQVISDSGAVIDATEGDFVAMESVFWT